MVATVSAGPYVADLVGGGPSELDRLGDADLDCVRVEDSGRLAFATQVSTRMRVVTLVVLPGAEIEVTACSPGHYEIRVVSEAFAGKSRVQQQQLVYRAITPLMSGDAAPVHAVDRMVTLTP